MKKIFTIILLLVVGSSYGQLLSWSPDFIQETSNGITITMNANFGNKGLLNYTPSSDVYIHTGVITNLSTSSSDWKYVRTVWATTYSWEHATYIGNNQWQFTIDTTGGLRAFYGMTNASEHIQKIAILFRSGNGNYVQRNADASDMFIPVYDNGLYARIDNPFRQPKYVPVAETITKNVGDQLPIVAKASLAGSSIQIYFNGNLLSTVTGTKDSITTSRSISGTQTIIAKATNGAATNSDTLSFYVNPPNNVAAIPSGDVEGINYEPGDTSVTLVVYAPLKKSILVLGDFNNWITSSKYLMNITPDGNYFWLRITGLTPGVQYAYQYLIDNNLQVADYNSELVLDKSADPYIPSGNFPGLKAFPAQAAGTLAGVLQTAQTPYSWGDNSFVKPDKRNLVIYELLVRDFVVTESWNTLTDTLSYLKKLGINAIEVMPFCNFEGASSWGYNPNFFFAPDKVYGTPDALKHFIDICHQNGMAVIMDLAMQDVFGSSPLAAMYWNSTTNTPSLQNPWLDSLPTHPYNVGSQFNHSSAATIDLRNRVYAYWINNYHLDGFRFDLAGGYTQTQYSLSNDTWESTYDQGRVNTWDSIYSKLQSIKSGTYCILESFVNYSEQKIYTDNGMLTWGNGSDENYAFTQASMGYYNSGADFSSGIYSSAGLTQPGMVTYQESHDETLGGDERIMFKNENYGASSGSYTVKDTATALKRAAMTAAFWSMIPGPKMMLMFGELGYDYSPNACSNGATTCSNIDPKPIRWDYYTNPNRLALYNVYSKLLSLRNVPAYLSTFTTGTVNKNLSGAVKWMNVTGSPLQVMVYGNFDVAQETGTISFPSTGTWYNLFTGAAMSVTTTSLQNVTLQPGEYYVYVNLASALPVNWLSFTAQKNAKQSVILNWTTSSELNNSYFEVQRSADGNNYSAIGNVAAGINPNMEQHYQFTDVQPINGINYYRLKQVNKDGGYGYSSVREINFQDNALWRVYPNPANNNTSIYVQSDLNKLQYMLTDISGKILYKYQVSSASPGQRLSIPVQNLGAGIYLLKITSNEGSSTEKLIVH